VLASQRANESGLVDPEVQISADEVQENNCRAYNNSRYEQG
jgi:hypothetical protein